MRLVAVMIFDCAEFEYVVIIMYDAHPFVEDV
jgi:hypothetical protein